METLAQANIFFFITTIAVIIFTLLGSIALYYLIRILHDVRASTALLKEKVEHASEEVAALGAKVRESVVFNLLFAKKRHKK